MTLANHISTETTRRYSFLPQLRSWILAKIEQRRTINALRNCRPRDLQDVGIISHDITELEHGNAVDAAESLSRTASQRAGNW